MADDDRASGAETLWGLVAARAAVAPSARMIVDDAGRTLTVGEYRDRAEAAAAGLAARGVSAGSVVSWVLPTWIEALVLLGALARLGAVQNPVLPVYRHRELDFVVRQAGSGLLIVPPVWRGFDYPQMATDVAGGVGGLDVLVVDRVGGLPEADPAGLPPFRPSTDVRWLFYTSGTTADPKGVRHTDASVIASARGVNRSVEITADDTMGVVFPYTHIGGVALLAGALLAGYDQIVVEAFDPATTIPLLRRHGVSIAGAGTYFWTAYLEAQRAHPEERLFPRLRALVGGGSAKPAGLNDRVRVELGGRGTVSGYGLTECPSCVLCSIHDPDDKLSSSDGRPVDGVVLRIVDPAGVRCAPGGEGEIQVRGPMLFAGYVDRTLDAGAFTADGWLRTGDLGRVDAEGYLSVTGRLKEIIIRKGENISAREVEEVLLGHAAVRDVAVVGVPDDERGEMACAFVVLAPGASPVTVADLAAHCRAAGLAPFKAPERVELIEALPRNPTGKVLRNELRASVVGPAERAVPSDAGAH